MERILSANTLKFLDTELINYSDFFNLFLRFILNFLTIFIIIRILYYPSSKRKDYLFSYFLISIVIFLLCFLLENAKLQIGIALGLFAIFGIIRYRTDTIPIKEMTYLFVVIAISVINALAKSKVSYAEIIFTNFIVIIITYLLEYVFLIRHEASKIIKYEKIDLIKPNKKKELIEDLEKRTGLKINRVEIGRIDFQKGNVRIKIYYYEDENNFLSFEDNYMVNDND